MGSRKMDGEKFFHGAGKIFSRRDMNWRDFLLYISEGGCKTDFQNKN
jgi:hypothetical protein